MGNWRTILGLVLSLIGVGASFSSFVFFYYENYHAGVWALISGVLAAVDFHLYFLHWKGTLVLWHNTKTLKDFEILALFGLVFGISAGIWYIFIFLYYNLPILPVPDSYQIAAVWAFMTAKWGLGLLLTSRHLSSQVQMYPPLEPMLISDHRSPHYINRISI